MRFTIQRLPPSATRLSEARRTLCESLVNSDTQRQALFQTSVAAAGALMFGMTLLSIKLSDSPLGIGLGALVIGASLVFAAVLIRRKRRLDAQREDDEAQLKALEPLEMETNLYRCLDLLEWAARDTSVQTYLYQLAAIGRVPVYGEWRAARDWITA